MACEPMPHDLVVEMIGTIKGREFTGVSRERRLEVAMVEFVRTLGHHHTVMAHFPDEMAGALTRMVALLPRRQWTITAPRVRLGIHKGHR